MHSVIIRNTSKGDCLPFCKLFICFNRSCMRVQYAFHLCVKRKTSNMKKSFLAFTLVFGITVLQKSVYAQEMGGSMEGKNMLGIRISSADPVINHSITYKRFLNPTLAIEGLFSFSDPAALGLLLEKHTPFAASGLTWFWGAGAYAAFSGGRRFGAQGAVGLDFVLPSLPLNLSVDWKPELNFTKQFSFEPAAVGFSARFVF
jgi:hypothetical protein